MTLHRGETPGSVPSHFKLNYGKSFLWILVHILALIRLKNHQRQPVQSYLSPSAPPVPGPATAGGEELWAPFTEWSDSKIHVGVGCCRLCNSNWAAWGSKQSKCPICTLNFTHWGLGHVNTTLGAGHEHVFCRKQVSRVRMVLKSVCSAREDRLSKLSLFHSIM